MDVLGKLLNTQNARFILSYAYQPPMYMLDSTNQHANNEPKIIINFLTDQTPSLADQTVDGKMKEHKMKTKFWPLLMPFCQF